MKEVKVWEHNGKLYSSRAEAEYAARRLEIRQKVAEFLGETQLRTFDAIEFAAQYNVLFRDALKEWLKALP